MRRVRGVGGYTIVETLIFLAISMAIFIGAVAAYSANQRRVDFTQGVQELQANLESIINEVNSGNYDSLSAINWRCNANNTNGKPDFFNDTTSDSSTCVMLGKVFSTGLTNYCPTETVGCNSYAVFQVAARRDFYVSGKPNPIDSLVQAKPMGLTAFNSATTTTRPDMTQTFTIPNGVRIYRICERTSAGLCNGSQTGAFAFMTSLGKVSGNTLDAGNSVSLVKLLTTGGFTANSNQNANDAVEALTDAAVNPANGIVICLSDGGDQRAAIQIGGNSRQLDVITQPRSSLDGACN